MTIIRPANQMAPKPRDTENKDQPDTAASGRANAAVT